MVVIIDYQMGNKQSVSNAFASLGCAVVTSHQPEDIKQATHLVLPGVGAFGDGMKNLTQLGLIPILAEEVLGKKKPFLGVCLGMQLLATKGTEYGQHQGLNWIPGVVDLIPSQAELRIPHVGWNNVAIKRKHPLVNDLGEEATFYFVHSYHFQPESPEDIVATCKYGIEFAAILQKDNIFATQFHPEKSHKDGMLILKNFLHA